MAPSFLYFDLGNVLLHFDHRRGARQMADVAGADEQRVWQALFESPLETRFERGEIDERQFFDSLCEAIGYRPDFHRLMEAGNDIFRLNATILPLIAHLEDAGHRMGVLSNTNSSHWNFCTRYFGILPDAFDEAVLSFEVGAMKPDPAIYRAAADRAAVAPEEIFFVDDRWEHVEGARQAGFDAVPYTSTLELAQALRQRGVRSNY